MKRCAFCPTEATRLSGEHIWDDWLNRALPTKRFKVRQKWNRLDPFREYDARIIKEKLPVVCEECNNTWMSDLSNRTKQAFSEMIVNGTPTALQRTDIHLLAAFTDGNTKIFQAWNNAIASFSEASCAELVTPLAANLPEFQVVFFEPLPRRFDLLHRPCPISWAWGIIR
jgi:hypothetical protein